MSVKNETFDLHKQSDRADEAPGLEYRSVSHDSLSMFLAALGGAILGVLLTLLILAIINGGTLNFMAQGSVASLEATVSRVNENVGTLSQNVDTLGQNVNVLGQGVGTLSSDLAAVRDGLTSAQAQLQTVAATVADQETQQAAVGEQIDDINGAIATLDVTRQRFDTFVDALGTALAEMDAGTQGAAAPAGR
jgi:uncharacterized phage infection (PIP) family protein YhgE